MKCLFELNHKKLNTLIKDKLQIENWFIRNEKISNRTDSIIYSNRFQFLRDRATKLNFNFDELEIVTWLDTLMILYYTFDKIEDKELKNRLTILQEYCIPYSNKRADYLLILENKILIIEFSFNKLNYELQYETKLQQAIGYKEMLSNILPKNIDIATYTFIIEAEEDKNGNTIYLKGTDKLPNYYKTKDLAQYIEAFFKKDNETAINALKNINFTEEIIHPQKNNKKRTSEYIPF